MSSLCIIGTVMVQPEDVDENMEKQLSFQGPEFRSAKKPFKGGSCIIQKDRGSLILKRKHNLT